MAVGVVPSTALANGLEESQLTQTATNLNQNYISEVTLPILSDSYCPSMDVVFVLDGSTSSDQTNLANDAAEMLGDLGELAQNQRLDLQAGMVIFGGSVPILVSRDLQDMSDTSNLSALQVELTDKSYDGMTGRSGSNLQAGIEKARELLKSGEADADHKYLVVLTDGGARMWVNDAGEALAQLPYVNNWNTTEDFIARYINGSLPLREFETIMQDAASGKEIGRFAITESQSKDSNNTVENLSDGMDVGTSSDYYTNLESATYFAAKSLMEIKETGEANVIWVDYPYNKGTKYGDYTESFKSWLAQNGCVTRYDSDKVEDPFAEVKDNLICYVDKGSRVENVIGYGADENGNEYDFDMVNLDSMKLLFGDAELSPVMIGENRYGFGTLDTVTNQYPFELTYYPEGKDNSGKDSFELAINTAITLETPVQLIYQVQLTNPQTEVGAYGTYDEDGSEQYNSLRVSESATLYPVDSNGNEGQSLPYTRPTVEYSVIGVNPASLTIYMGGTSGYENIVNEDGETLKDTVSLPEPGFYLSLPDSVNNELRNILGKDENDVIDLSQYVTLSAVVTDGNENVTNLTWKLERYGVGSEETSSAGYIDASNCFIYKIVPDGTGAKVRVKVSTTKEGSDEFDATEALYETYNMEIYGEGVDEGSLTAQISIEGTEEGTYLYNKSFGLVGGDPAELTVRYVAGQQEDVVTKALDNITDEHDPGKAYVVLKDQDGNKAEDFIINEAVKGADETSLKVQAAPESVSLLFDDIVSTNDTGDKETHFEKTLVDNAVKATGQNFENLQYQAKYLDLVDADNGNTWLTTGDKVTVYWPYPEGTNAETKFYLQHFLDIDRDGTLEEITKEVEEKEPDVVEIHTDANGIYFETDSFSPYVLMWDDPAPAEDKGDEEQPASTPKPTQAPTEKTEAASVSAQVTSGIPQTGDASQPLVWVALVVISGAALACLVVYRKKRSSK